MFNEFNNYEGNMPEETIDIYGENTMEKEEGIERVDSTWSNSELYDLYNNTYPNDMIMFGKKNIRKFIGKRKSMLNWSIGMFLIPIFYIAYMLLSYKNHLFYNGEAYPISNFIIMGSAALILGIWMVINICMPIIRKNKKKVVKVTEPSIEYCKENKEDKEV